MALVLSLVGSVLVSDVLSDVGSVGCVSLLVGSVVSDVGSVGCGSLLVGSVGCGSCEVLLVGTSCVIGYLFI